MYHDLSDVRSVIMMQIILNKHAPNLFQSKTTQNTIDGKGNGSDHGDKSPASKPKEVNDESTNAYGSLNKTDGLGEHTYASLNKAGSGKNSSGGSDGNTNAGYIAMTAPVSNGGSDRSEERNTGVDSRNKDSGSSDVNSARAGKCGEVRKVNKTPGLSPVFHMH